MPQKRKSSKSFFNQKKEKDKEKEHEEKDKEKEREKEARENTLQKRTRVSFFKEKKERERAEQEEQEKLERERREQSEREFKERERKEKSEGEEEPEGCNGVNGEPEPLFEVDQNGRESDMELSEEDSTDSRDVPSSRSCSDSFTEQNGEARDEILKKENSFKDGLEHWNSTNGGVTEETQQASTSSETEAVQSENTDSAQIPIEPLLVTEREGQVLSQVGPSLCQYEPSLF